MTGYGCLALAAMVLTAVCASGQESAITVPLTYEAKGWHISIPVPLEGHECHFKAEPKKYRGSYVTRVAIPVGADVSKWIGLACYGAEQKLYVDLNRDWDLTNDKDNVYEPAQLVNYYPGITISNGPPGAEVRCVVDVDFSQGGMIAVLRSAWRGETRLGRKTYKVLVANLLDGDLSGPNNLFDICPESRVSPYKNGAGVVPLPPGNRIAVDGHEYRFSWKKNGDNLDITFTEQPSAMGAVSLPGTDIERLILEGPLRAYLDQPAAKVMLPVGHYSVAQLDVCTSQVYRMRANALPSYRAPEIDVSADKPLELKLGAPIGYSATVRREWDRLHVHPYLGGIGGEPYAVDAKTQPGRVTFSQNGRRIHSGRFSYS